MKTLLKAIRAAFYYIYGKMVASFMYDKKYITGRWFKGVHGTVDAIGWKWCVYDKRGRFRFGRNRGIPFPVSPMNTVQMTEGGKIEFHPDDLEIFQGYGKYFQASFGGNIIIGKGTWIAPNVGIITSNHDLKNPEEHTPGKDVVFGEKCWVGMNCTILPGVELGNNTVVAAGSTVTKSFKDGNCVIGGTPAKVIKYLED